MSAPAPPAASTTTSVVPWGEPLAIWIVTRFVFCIAMYAGALFFPCPADFKSANPAATEITDVHRFYADYAARQAEFGAKPMIGHTLGGRWSWLKPLFHWDAFWWLSVAEAGYVVNQELAIQQNVAFFPLYPLGIAALKRVGLPTPLGALVLANAATLGTALVLFGVVWRKLGPGAARWALLLWMCYPAALFGCVPYADSLLALWGMLALAAVWDERYLRAGCWTALATATRPPGLALGIPFLAGLCSRKGGWAFLGGILAGSGIAAYFLYLGAEFGDVLLYPHVVTKWHAGVKTANPAAWALNVVRATLQVVRLVLERQPILQFYSCRLTDPLLVWWTLYWLPRTRQLGWGVLGGAALMIALPLSTGTVASFGRYSWVAMPLFVAAGHSLEGRPARWWLLWLFGAAAVWQAFLFGGGWEVI